MQLVCDTKYRLSCPTVDPSTGIIYALCRQSGAVLAIEPDSGNNCTRIGDTNGQPAALVVSPFPTPASAAASYEGAASPNDAYATSFLLADPNRQGIVAMERTGDALVNEANGGMRNGIDTFADVITAFEGKPLFGPSSIAIDPQGEIIFADGGLPGDSSLTHRVGAIYRTTNRRTQLTRLVKPSLACPSAIATTSVGGGAAEVIYVAEMAENRVLRMTRLADGYFYTSVFARMSGTMGPVALAVHPTTKSLYVAMYELDVISANNGSGSGGGSGPALGVGSVHVYDPLGELLGTIAVKGSQITGICFSADYKRLFITVDGGAGNSSYLYSTPVSD